MFYFEKVLSISRSTSTAKPKVKDSRFLEAQQLADYTSIGLAYGLLFCLPPKEGQKKTT